MHGLPGREEGPGAKSHVAAHVRIGENVNVHAGLGVRENLGSPFGEDFTRSQIASTYRGESGVRKQAVTADSRCLSGRRSFIVMQNCLTAAGVTSFVTSVAPAVSAVKRFSVNSLFPRLLIQHGAVRCSLTPQKG